MSFGDRRGPYKWVAEEPEALQILEAAHDAGINFFDMAPGYSNGVTEEILGKAIQKFKWRRENIVVATKVWAPVGLIKGDTWEDPSWLSADQRDNGGYVNAYGSSRKHIFDSVDASLKRLQLDYIDLLQIHRFDPNVPIKETMKALHDIVESGKVRYIGASSMYAHQLLEMQYTARLHGWTEFISMQNLHSPIYREEEREMIPSLQKFGMGMIPWAPLAMGFLARPHEAPLKSERGKVMDGKFMGFLEFTDADKNINQRIAEIAEEKTTTMAVVALAWCLSKEWITAPIVGMGKLERVEEAVKATELMLSKEETESIDRLYKVKDYLMV